jgi:cullin 1
MEVMVNDYKVSKEIQDKFNNSDNNLKIKFDVTVLKTAVWPAYKTSDLILPSEMARCLEEFKKFYSVLRANRKLRWIFSLGTCDIISKFDSKVIEMAVTTYQAVVLLLFNDSNKLSYEEIKSQLNLEDKDVIRLLHSVSCGKYKILLKAPSSTTISPGDIFEFNPSFSHKLKKIKIPLPEVNEKLKKNRIPLAEVNENKRVSEIVHKERNYAIDVAIMRIMKAKKILHEQQLLSDCVENLQKRFKPEFKAIKVRIKDLIARDYLERDNHNSKLLRYLP